MPRNHAPTVIKELKNTRKDRINQHEPQPSDRKPTCPAWLDHYAKLEWRRMADELHKMGLLSYVDGPALALYCDAYGRWRKAEELFQEEGRKYYIKSYSGGLYINPLLNVASAARKEVYKMLREFGMTPSARAGLEVKPAEQEDIASALFKAIKSSGT